VPERRQERTTEGGLDVVAGGDELAARVRALVGAGIKVSLFIGADTAQIDRSRAIGAAQIELHTGEYAHGREGELTRLAAGAKHAHALGLEVAAGHGLTQDNVPALVAIPEIVELNIGHAVIADAVFAGLRDTVHAYQAAIARGVSARVS
jgi:pyridoxine 5-phosphate synthase